MTDPTPTAPDGRPVPPDGAGGAGRFRVPRASWALAAFCLTLPPIVWGLSQIRLENDVENWLPEGDPYAARLAWFEDHFPSDERLVVSWDGADADDPRLTAFAAALRGTPDAGGTPRDGSRLIESAVTPAELAGRMVDAGVDPADAVRRVVGLLAGGGPLRVQLSDAGRADPATAAERIRRAVKVAAGLEAEVAAPVRADEFAPDPPADAAARLGPGDGPSEEGAEPPFAFPPVPPHDLIVRWPRMDADADVLAAATAAVRSARDAEGRNYVADVTRTPGSPAAVSVTLSKAGAADRKAAVAALHAAGEAVGVGPDELRIGGRTVTALAMNASIKRTAFDRGATGWAIWDRSPVLLSFAVSCGLAFWLLGGVRIALCVLGATVYAVFASLCLVPLTGGEMNMVLIVMPSLLLVLTLSAGVHLVNYYRHAAGEGEANAVGRALATARQPTTLAACTTAVGLASLWVSPLVPVSQFGLYSAVGCGVMLAVILCGLPALLEHLTPPPRDAGAGSSLWPAFAEALVKRRRLVTLGCLLAAAVCSLGLTRFRTETKVIKYFPETAKVVRDYGFFEDRITGVIPVEVVVRFDAEATKSPNLRFTDRMELVREVAERVGAHPEISGALSLASFRPPSEPLPEGAGRFARIRYFREAAETEKAVRENPAAAGFLTTAHAEAPPSEAGVPVAQPGDELWRIGAQANILTEVDYAQLTADLDAAAADVLKDEPGAGYAVTGLVPLFLRTQQAVLDGLLWSFGLAFAVIAAVLSVVLGSVRAGLTAMLPNVLPVSSVFGLVSWAAVPVDIGTMISASVALGIAVDGTLHLVAAFRHAPARLDRKAAAAHALVACGPALWQTSLIVGLGLLMLAPAELLLVSRFGWLMAALIGAALIADVVLLPALLAGPMGKLIRRGPAAPAAAPVIHAPGAEARPEPRPQLAAFSRPT